MPCRAVPCRVVSCCVVAYLYRVNVSFAKLQILGGLQSSEAICGLGADLLRFVLERFAARQGPIFSGSQV